MTNTVYFFDSYAIIEIINGNKQYKKYTESMIITTKLNLFEIYYFILKQTGEKEKNLFDKYYEFVVDFDKTVIKRAAELKLKYKKRDLSMTDCIGYALSERLGVKFLTGDKEFKDLANVEYVK